MREQWVKTSLLIISQNTNVLFPAVTLLISPCKCHYFFEFYNLIIVNVEIVLSLSQCHVFIFSITYDKYFQEFYSNENPKAMTYLKISPKNVDRRLMKEYFVYSWTNFFSDMGSFIGLLLGKALNILLD